MDKLVEVSANIASDLSSNAPVIAVLLLVIIGGALVGWKIISFAGSMFKQALEQCEKREERAILNWEKANDRSVQALDRVNDTFKDVRVLLAEIKATSKN